MPQNNITTWLNFAIQQMAAESYLQGFPLSNQVELIKRLKLGNNNIPGANPDDDLLGGKTRFTNVLAGRFVNAYDIVDHHANDATGFSATLLFDTQTNSYTLSFRSTEFRTQANGGDRERDGVGADLEVATDGFAFGQLMAMEDYYQSLKASGQLPAGAVLNVTGYSLGGHLATVFTELHPNEINHTYTFNGAGRGHITGAGSTEAERIQGMLTLFRTVLFSPEVGLSIIADQFNPRYLAAAPLVGQAFSPFTSETVLGGAGIIYTDARYRWALEVATTAYDTTGVASSPEEVGTGPAFDKITQLYGLATTGDLTVVANSGVHTSALPVLIEGQPQIEGVPLFQDQTSFGNTHSITLLVDSLAVQELIQTIDPHYGQAGAELLIKAASNTKADSFAPLDTPDVVEADSLERTVDAFRKLFLGPTPATATPLPVDSRVGGFGNMANRNAFYDAIAEVKSAANTKYAGTSFTITDMTQLSAPMIAGTADTDTLQGLAYRYALQELNPFAVIGTDPHQTLSLYQPHNRTGQLNLIDPVTSQRALSAQYLDDRARFLVEQLVLHTQDATKSHGNIHFLDVASGKEITTTNLFAIDDQQFIFDSDASADAEHPVQGEGREDHLYGAGGNDVLLGQGGRDYLEGGQGNDRLDGGTEADEMRGGAGDDVYVVDDLGDRVTEFVGEGLDSVESSVRFALGANLENLTLTGAADVDGIGNELANILIGNSGENRLAGGAGDDRLQGGTGNDVLEGGIGNDLLEGGAGDDVYRYVSGDGVDRIEDTQGKNTIFVDGHPLLPGLRPAGGSGNVYTSVDGQFIYTQSGGDLLVSRPGGSTLLILNENFQSGQFGITLQEEPSYANDLETRTNADYPGAFNDLNNGVFLSGPYNNHVHGLGGNDSIFASIDADGNDQLYGDEGDDRLQGEGGHDRLFGGDGADFLMGQSGDDRLEGGTGNDQLQGGYGVDILLGGDGNDLMMGDLGTNASDSLPFDPARGADDLLDGGAGNDKMEGESGNDTLTGGGGDDEVWGGFWIVQPPNHRGHYDRALTARGTRLPGRRRWERCADRWGGRRYSGRRRRE
ncbi:MAG: calcium-binding protein [Nitrospira sp.]|jgi:Ca2+-binding RTX toxin-like protein|nr:MAG: calcium-binding protein [Nitrospira sp.]